MRRRRRFSSPLALRRLALGLIAAGAFAAGLGALFRTYLDPAANLLALAGWLSVIAGGVIEARVGALLVEAEYPGARRRAFLLLVGGTTAILIACTTIAVVIGASNPIRFPATALLAAGIGAGLGGGLTLLVVHGGNYLADRIARMDDN